MVFKVKQRARNNYAAVTKTSERASGFNKDTEEDLKSKGIYIAGDQELKYSYNWPYDFFSLVELAKVNVETTFTPVERDVSTTVTETITSRLDPSTGEYIQQTNQATLQKVTEEKLNQTQQPNMQQPLGDLQTGIIKER